MPRISKDNVIDNSRKRRESVKASYECTKEQIATCQQITFCVIKVRFVYLAQKLFTAPKFVKCQAVIIAWWRPVAQKFAPKLKALFTRKKAPLNFLLFFMRILIQCFLFCLSFLILSETLWREAWGEIHLLLVALVVCFFSLQTTWQSRK